MAHPRFPARRTSLHVPPERFAMRLLPRACLIPTVKAAIGFLMATAWSATAPVSAATAGGCTAASPAYTLALAELYTSEGCDSCPPADKWLSGLAAKGWGPDKVVPLSLHVDYWDYIGWKDVFAQRQFTARQRNLAKLGGSTFVYTPQVVLAGRDFRGWSGGAFDAQVKAVNARPARADIELALSLANGQVSIIASATGKSGTSAALVAPGASGAAGAAGNRAQLFVALTQNRIVSPVKSGENRGVTLTHDYVVREWLAPAPLGADGKARIEKQIVPPKGAPTNDLGVVAFVQDVATGEVLQALKLEACRG